MLVFKSVRSFKQKKIVQKVLINTGSYVLDLGFSELIRQLNLSLLPVYTDYEIIKQNCKYLITTKNIFDNLYSKQNEISHRNILIIDKTENNIINLDRTKLNNFFNSFFKTATYDLENQELTEREKDIIKLVAMGLQNKEIADKLNISIHTVTTHRKNITNKLGIKSISGLTVFAILNGIIDIDSINPHYS